jgi:hypothetical protein
MIGLYTRSNTAVNSRTSLPNISAAKNCPILHRFEVRIQVFDWGIREGMKKLQEWADRASWKKAIARIP